MAVVNATPDSFSGDGVLRPGFSGVDLARFIDALVRSGPDIVDIGAESTRPGHGPQPAGQQIDRLAPVLAAVVRALPDVPISVDTTSAEVATFALASGASIVNDVSGVHEPDLVDVVVAGGASLVVTHSSARPGAVVIDPVLGGGYGRVDTGPDGIVASVRNRLDELCRAAEQRGLARDNLIVDPGIGFGKDTGQNIELARGLSEFRSLGFRVLYGPSRKRFIGDLTGRPVGERTYGTAAAVALAVAAGVDIVRVHDVEAMTDVVRVADALTGCRSEVMGQPSNPSPAELPIR